MDDSQRDLKMYLAEKDITVEEFSQEIIEIIIDEIRTFGEIENVPEFEGRHESLIRYLVDHLNKKLDNV